MSERQFQSLTNLDNDKKVALSIIIPIFNEKENIAGVIEEVIEKVTPLYELDLIIIDDGSDDQVSSLLEKKASIYSELRWVIHPKRSGKSAGLRTGMLMAKNLWVGTMDGDGQDDPQNILNMVEQIDLSKVGKVGLVAGNRLGRNDGNNRKWASRFANGLRQKVLDDKCPDTACGLKLVARDLFLVMPFFDALHRYLPAFTNHLGFETINFPVTNRPRRSGQSKYSNVGRAIAGLFDLYGVVWLMRRTHSPGASLLLRSAVVHTKAEFVNELQSQDVLSSSSDLVQVPS